MVNFFNTPFDIFFKPVYFVLFANKETMFHEISLSKMFETLFEKFDFSHIRSENIVNGKSLTSRTTFDTIHHLNQLICIFDEKYVDKCKIVFETR